MAKSKYKPTGKGSPGPYRKGFDPGRNLRGRPKGSCNKFSMTSFAKAIKSVEYDKKEAFMIAWIEAAWGVPAAMSEIINYMRPKLRSIDGILTTMNASMDDETAKAIQDKIKERFL